MKKKIYDYSENILNEIFMMALTYRVSLRNLCLMFTCSFDDLNEAIKKRADMGIFIDSLDKCTINEDEEMSRISFERASAYWKKRQELLKKLRNAKTIGEKNDIKEELKVHRSLIDDIYANKLINRSNYRFSSQDKDVIANFRVKYSFSKEKTAQVLNINHNIITIACEEKALKDPIYAKQLEAINNYNKSYFKKR